MLYQEFFLITGTILTLTIKYLFPIFKPIFKTKQYGEGENTEDAETDKAHKVITESQEAAEVVYFIEGLKSKEL